MFINLVLFNISFIFENFITDTAIKSISITNQFDRTFDPRSRAHFYDFPIRFNVFLEGVDFQFHHFIKGFVAHLTRVLSCTTLNFHRNAGFLPRFEMFFELVNLKFFQFVKMSITHVALEQFVFVWYIFHFNFYAGEHGCQIALFFVEFFIFDKTVKTPCFSIRSQTFIIRNFQLGFDQRINISRFYYRQEIMLL